MNKLESSFQNSFSTCLVAKVFVTNEMKTMKTPKLFPKAQELLLKDPNQFYTNYGDRFIAGIRTGGELYVVYEFSANSVEEKNQLTAHLKVKADGLTNSLQAVLDYTTSVEAENKNKKMTVHIYRIGDKSDLPDNNIPEIIKYINSFASKVTPTNNEAFLHYITLPYTEAGWTQPLANKQKSLDSLANLQRKIYQLLSWKQENIKEILKDIDFALNKTFWELTSSQSSSLSSEKERLKKLDEKLNNCYNTCKDIAQCQDCKTIINEILNAPQFDSYKSTDKFDYNTRVAKSEVTHVENTLCKLEPNTKYKLVFDGNLLAPGNIPFDAFVSPQNDARAITFSSLGTNITAYPILCIRVFGMGENEGKMMPVNSNQKIMEIATKGSPVTIMGATRYYIPGQGIWQENTPIYLTPSPGWTWPTISVFKWEKL
jgi:hypothetical protein